MNYIKTLALALAIGTAGTGAFAVIYGTIKLATAFFNGI